MLDHTGCRAVVVAGHYLDSHTGVPFKTLTRDRVAMIRVLAAGFSADDPNVEISPDDWYIIRHTGGTTEVKGVAYSHRSWLAAGRDCSTTFRRWRLAMRMWGISHEDGLSHTPTVECGTNVMLDHFDPAETIEIMERERSRTCLRAGNVECHGRNPCCSRDWSSRGGANRRISDC